MNPLPAIIRSAGTAVALAIPMAAQCTNVFLQAPAATFSGHVFASVPWDPDGAGPQPAGVVVAGDFLSIGGQSLQKVALYHPDSDTWTALPGLSSTGEVRALCVLLDGSLVAGGSFTGSATRLARWTGTTWTTIGGGVSGSGTGVLSLLVEPNGDLLVGGTFLAAGTTPATGIARWNGTAWTALPGLQWVSPVGVNVYALARASNGDIYAGGLIALPGGFNLARWDGSTWTPVWTGPSFSFALSLLALPNGEVMAGIGNGIYVWNGTNLQQLAYTNADIRALRQLPNGDVLVAGQFTQLNSQPVDPMARWNGTTWTPVAGASDQVLTLCSLPSGNLLVAGSALQTLSSTCPATVGSYGGGCSGSGGQNELAATTLPWIGSTFRARAVGMPPQAFVLSVYGFTPLSIPFASVFPQALPGCTILMSGDLIDVLFPTAGAADTQLPLPNTAAIVGATFHHYVVPFEVDAALSITAITNSNALTCTVGAF